MAHVGEHYSINRFMGGIRSDVARVFLYIYTGKFKQTIPNEYGNIAVKLLAYQVAYQDETPEPIKLYNSYLYVNPDDIGDERRYVTVFIENVEQTFEADGREIPCYDKEF